MSGLLLDHLWQSTLFGLALWSITLALRNNFAAVRHWLWLLASIKFLVPFALLHAMGAAAGVTHPIEDQPGYLAVLGSVESVVAPVALLGSAPAASPTALTPVLLGAWILGSLWLGLRWFAGWRLASRLSAAARPAAGAAPDIHLVDADIEPSVARVFRSVVLLPAALPAKLSGPELDAVLEHEREHIERHDNVKAHVHRLVEALFWFHPLVWFIGRRLVDERERACDEAVLARGHDAGEYAAGILAVCRHCRSHSPHTITAVSGDLPARVRDILSGASPASLGFIKAFALTGAALLLAVLPLVSGALDGSAHRRELAATNARLLLDAQVAVREAAGDDPSVDVSGDQVVIRNFSLRELIALTYEVEGRHVKGNEGWLDSPRYDIRVALAQRLREPEDFDPAAMRTMVNRLLAARFALEIHVNDRCQDPCGPRALAVTGN